MNNPQTHKVEFSVMNNMIYQKEGARSELTGTLIDISRSGIGFITDIPLKPGNVLRFKNFEAGNSGIVMWTLETEKSYRVGVRLVED